MVSGGGRGSGKAGGALTDDVYVNMTNFKITPATDAIWAKDEYNSADVTLRSDCETLNLSNVEAGEFWGWASSLDFLKAWKGKASVDPSDYFYIDKGKLYFKQSCVPNLMSANAFITKESGFYLFEKS